MKTTNMMKAIGQPTRAHQFGLVRDLFGNAGVVVRCGSHIDYIWGLFKGRECTRRDREYFEQWYKECDMVPLLGHPTRGDIVLVMGCPVKELTGEDAARVIQQVRDEEGEFQNAKVKIERDGTVKSGPFCCQCHERRAETPEDELCKECWDAGIEAANATRKARLAAGWTADKTGALTPPRKVKAN